jgi:hypothetical protein
MLDKNLASLSIQRGIIFIAQKIKSIDHPKLFVLIGENDNECVGYFFINSNINSFIASRPDFMNMQMPLKHSNYKDFLKHDSFISCHELIKIKKYNLIERICNGTFEYRGQLNDDDLELLMHHLRNSDLYSKIEKETFFK